MISKLKKLAHESHLLVFSGPSGVGKSTLIRKLIKLDARLRYSVSTTTRQRRTGEIHETDYHFVDEEGFIDMVTREVFLEYNYHHGSYYGTRRSNFANGGAVIMDIDPITSIQLRTLPELKERMTSFFIAPENMEQLEEQLRGRKDTQEDSISARLQHGIESCKLGIAENFDHIFINPPNKSDVLYHGVYSIVQEIVGCNP